MPLRGLFREGYGCSRKTPKSNKDVAIRYLATIKSIDKEVAVVLDKLQTDNAPKTKPQTVGMAKSNWLNKKAAADKAHKKVLDLQEKLRDAQTDVEQKIEERLQPKIFSTSPSSRRDKEQGPLVLRTRWSISRRSGRASFC